ncbi:MAG: Flp pilus assembly protein CpaB [Candidatus Omnitrophica bacterium]|nr:Flp pilus assembly protein CpaB [Candidatus Omnitrophota bacterium]
MQRQKIIIIIGVVLALMAVFMTKAYIDQQRQQVIDESKKKIASLEKNISKHEVKVLIANKDIPRGAAIAAESLETIIIPDQYLQPQAVSSADRILGMVAVVAISKGEQISLSKLVQPRQLGGLAEGTPVGKRAITISVDNISALGGMIKPGDYVDVMALVPVPVQTADGKQVSQMAVMPLFQNVLVLAVGQDTGSISAASAGKKETERRSENSPLITLALGPQEANLIAFVQEQGKLRLTLRSPADSQMQATQPASWETLFRYVMPAQNELAKFQDKDAPATEYVEIYRGLSKEKMPLSK